MKRSVRRTSAILVGAVLAASSLSTPASSTETSGTELLIGNAVEAAAQPESAENDSVDIPATADEPVEFTSETGTVEIEVPASGKPEERLADGAVFDGDDKDTKIAVESTTDGVRALIAIDSQDAPERFSFAFGGEVSSLELTETGSALAFDVAGNPVGIIDQPWAIDARGTRVPTHFEISGTTLIQVVEHKGSNFSYGIIADPWWNPFSWPWGKWVKTSKKGIKRALKKCGKGALTGALGMKVGNGTTNVLVQKLGKGARIKVAGGPWAYVGAGTAGCIVNQL